MMVFLKDNHGTIFPSLEKVIKRFHLESRDDQGTDGGGRKPPGICVVRSGKEEHKRSLFYSASILHPKWNCSVSNQIVTQELCYFFLKILPRSICHCSFHAVSG